MKELKILKLPNGKSPFKNWIRKLSPKARLKILDYLKRFSEGGSKRNIRALGDHIFEVKIDYGPGYRVYFGQANNLIILILLGGDKSTQKNDIKKAKRYWRTYVL